jgi:hypothetical protein
MIHTEDEAAMKICPEMSDGNAVRYCEGSRCMLWQDAGDKVEVFAIPPNARTPGDPPAPTRARPRPVVGNLLSLGPHHR